MRTGEPQDWTMCCGGGGPRQGCFVVRVACKGSSGVGGEAGVVWGLGSFLGEVLKGLGLGGAVVMSMCRGKFVQPR